LRKTNFNTQREISPVNKLKTKPAAKLLRFALQAKLIFFDFNKAAPKTAGIDARNENLKLVSMSIPLNNKVEMVIPEREIPGIMAIPCVSPKITASLKPTLFLFAVINFLVRINTMPVTIKATALKLMELKMLSKKSFPAKYIINVMSDTMTINDNNLGLPSALIISLNKKIIKAKLVPKCRTIDKSNSCPFIPNIFCIITKCAELLTGKNSVKPWIIPKMIYLTIRDLG
jgi:hypothetical protein